MTDREILFAKIGNIFEKMDDLFLSGRFEEAQEFAFSFDLGSITAEEILALMTMVQQVRHNKNDSEKMPKSQEFLDKAAAEIHRRYPDKEEADSILRGLV